MWYRNHCVSLVLGRSIDQFFKCHVHPEKKLSVCTTFSWSKSFVFDRLVGPNFFLR